MSGPTPILLLKTRSSPHDGYHEYLSEEFQPRFVPVLEHRVHGQNLERVRGLFASGAFAGEDQGRGSSWGLGATGTRFGGMIFTSQRAVEAFALMIEENGLPFTPSQTKPFPLYTVGPATARALATLRDKYLPSATIYGEDAGNGQNLAHLILKHYNTIYPDSTAEPQHGSSPPTKPSLLFLVGEQRRDIIPKTLMGPDRPETDRIHVEEIVVYETGEMESFETDFADAVRQCRVKTQHTGPTDAQSLCGPTAPIWVVVFSPTGCEAMLRVLKMGPFANNASDGNDNPHESHKQAAQPDVFIATIGPTTRDFLREKFAFEAHVCAEKPSPEGVAEGIRGFMAMRETDANSTMETTDP
ncbi:Uncharacterized protein PECH_001115 [Penicillium ucsense]|uniref:Tetrapyrrole biosynthesis uroporphyrinogen III synthase domain-containing protein n=1 Tax=Penicillium ucsense TaxID=2839758 RepID=A0A8J8WEV9_9EURO|nr:Uncharacterized protein PECM_000804 [Penicillium ucsense]KAF7733127.1 Uncharacterized protein PECH_001115 [Penicillium ucsense]